MNKKNTYSNKILRNRKLRVSFIGQYEYFSCHFEDDLDNDYDVFKKSRDFEERFNDLLEFNADINIFFRPETIPTEIVAKLKGISIGLSSEPFPKLISGKLNITKDSLGRFLYFLSAFDKAYDYLFHYDKNSDEFLLKQGIRFSGYFPLPIATGLYRPKKKKKNWDFLFIGKSTTHRENFFYFLKQRNYRFLHIAHGPFGRELLPYIWSSKVNFNIHASKEISWEPRMQMLLSCGALVVSETISPNEFIIPDKHFVHVENETNFDKRVVEILNSYETFDEMRRAGMSSVRKNLSAKINFRRLINNALDRSYPSPRFDKDNLDRTLLKLVTSGGLCAELANKLLNWKIMKKTNNY